MARPQKTGLDYFPVDVHCDNKIKLIEASYGLEGFAVIIRLWQKIYAEQGYYCDFDEESALLFAAENRIDVKRLLALTEDACRRGIFDQGIYKAHRVLTSHGIQKRYLEGAHRRNMVNLDSRFLLLAEDELTDNVTIDGVSVNKNRVNDVKSTQSKEKKKKEKDSIGYGRQPEKAAHTKKTDSLPKKSAFCNFPDTNPIDYAALEEQLLDRMVDENVC
ncbi:MAG: DUF4373 domain-containing protein [Clostridia bacterium]|nr:DUF4373 domain-containing protein [Clostridia bacterium]